jgi:RNA polymerase sigma-70 factor (ECF subfamily)
MTSAQETKPTEARLIGRGTFKPTHWSVVLATRDEDGPEARDALERLCRTYWFPLYAYVRRRGYSHEEAEDLTQAFLAHLLERNRIARADPQRGRFRSFLLAAMQNFLADHWDRLKAQKRGGRAPMVAWDSMSAESRYRSEAADPHTPEDLYQRQWAKALLEAVFERLRQEFEAQGKARLFAQLKVCLTQSRAQIPYGRLAAALDVGEAAVRMAVHRLRQRYRDLLRAEIARGLADPAEIEEELRDLRRVLAG